MFSLPIRDLYACSPQIHALSVRQQNEFNIIRSHVFRLVGYKLHLSFSSCRSYSGTTAVVALYRDGRVWVANAGDSRAVLATAEEEGGGVGKGANGNKTTSRLVRTSKSFAFACVRNEGSVLLVARLGFENQAVYLSWI